jgi:hypothetical protein
MGTFDETATVDYCLLFTTKENNFRFLFAENKRKCAISIFRLQQRELKFPFSVCIYIYIYIYIYKHAYIYIYVYKRKPRGFFLIRLPFAHHANGSLSFVPMLRKNKQKLSVCKRIKGSVQRKLGWV